MMSGKIPNNIRGNNRNVTRSLAAFTLAGARRKRLIKSRRAVSVVVSNLILIAAVIAVGFVVLAFTNSQSNNYVTEYGKTVSADIDQLRETLAFEYAFYNRTGFAPNNGSLTLYFINAGSVNNVNSTSVLLMGTTGSNSSWSTTIPVSTMHFLGSNIITKGLDIGQEGYVVLPIRLAPGSYLVKMTTWRGSIFEYTFDA